MVKPIVVNAKRVTLQISILLIILPLQSPNVYPGELPVILHWPIHLLLFCFHQHVVTEWVNFFRQISSVMLFHHRMNFARSCAERRLVVISNVLWVVRVSFVLILRISFDYVTYIYLVVVFIHLNLIPVEIQWV